MTELTPTQWIETMEIIRKSGDVPLSLFGHQDVIWVDIEVPSISQDDLKRLLELGWMVHSPRQIYLC